MGCKVTNKMRCCQALPSFFDFGSRKARLYNGRKRRLDRVNMAFREV